jgi:hypothetical protein
MNENLEMICKDICLEGIRKSMKNISQNRRCPGRVTNSAFPESDVNISGAKSGI